MRIVLLKAHPVNQAAARGTPAPNLNEGEIRRNPGEPSAKQAESDRYKKPCVDWNGLTLRIENPAGSVRRGRSRDGNTWETRMVYDYGYVARSEGVDGDEVDVYVGPNPDAPMVYVVHQRCYGDWSEYDEDKAMLGFDSYDDACAAYLKHYDDPRFLGPVTEMPVAEFCAKVRVTREDPAMIKAARELGDFGEGPRVLFLKAHVKGHTRRLPSGKVVTVDPYDTKVQKRGDGTGQMDMFAPADEHGEVAPGKKVMFTRKPGEKKLSEEEAMKELLSSAGAPNKDADGKQLIPVKNPMGLRQTENDWYVIQPGFPGVDGLEAGKAISRHAKEDQAAEVVRRQRDTGVKYVRGSRLSWVNAPVSTKKFYVTMIRGGKEKPAFLAGPFDSHDDALAHVEPARKKAAEVDPWSDFDAFGTTGVTAEKHPPGVLNRHLGIG